MIPDRIQALFDFIDFLHSNKENYITYYIPLIKELEILNNNRSELEPFDNYTKKDKYDLIQKEIEDKFPTITTNIYIPITEKLLELDIWSGDETYSSIWNSNINSISNFKNEFKSEDVAIIMSYKRKYLAFRTETHSNFLCLDFIFHELDKILKKLFDFFKDTEDNEFDTFEVKELKVSSVEELAKSISENKNKNVKYSLPFESFKEKQENTKNSNNNFNLNNYETIMGDKIIAENIQNNIGVMNVGKHNKSYINSNDELAFKSFNWQKFGVISATILIIISIIVAIIYSQH